ncbi:hypothetical protein QCA50_010203 [Cerrena zonata]|uniref:Mediator complex subunit 11 n=1 Tax=Cerrena zonata TaxID=2478898 RepID=A0AAW0FYL1_9APHY
MSGSQPTASQEQLPDPSQIDPIWASSRTARQIYALGEVEQSIHIAIRSSLAHIRQSRIAPSAINAPPPNFIPPPLGVGLPSNSTGPTNKGNRGLQEERIERDAWKGVLDALIRLKEAREGERARSQGPSQTSSQQTIDTDMSG